VGQVASGAVRWDLDDMRVNGERRRRGGRASRFTDSQRCIAIKKPALEPGTRQWAGFNHASMLAATVTCKTDFARSTVTVVAFMNDFFRR